jgi:hypothetical protein
MKCFYEYKGKFCAFILTLCLYCATAYSAPLLEQTLLARAEESVEDNNFVALYDLEPAALMAAEGKASRKGDKLSLRLRNTKVVDHVNSPECKSDNEEYAIMMCVSYSLIAYLPSVSRFLYQVSNDENHTYWLVDDNDGTEIQFNAIPLFSPDRAFFLLIYKDGPEFAYNLVIMRRTGREYKLDWQGNPRPKDKEPDYRFLRWKGNNKVCVTAEGEMYCMVHSDDGWKVSGPKNIVAH